MTAPTPRPLRRSRVLVVDDSESIRTLFRRLLIADGHEVISAGDGAAAFEAVRRHQPDVIVLEVCLPAMDGLEVCRRLKADPAMRLIPVVLVTSQTGLSDRIRGVEAGADEFLSKPVQPHELRACVNSLSRAKDLIDDVDSAETVSTALTLTIEARDPLINGNCERLANQAVSLLPACHAAAIQAPPPVAAPPPVNRPPASRGARVLIVDDELPVLRVASEMLKRAGFTVDTAAGGEQALALAGQPGRVFDVVLLDLTMPKMNGAETFRRLRRLDPGLRVVLMSGYPGDEAMSRFGLDGLSGFVQKPFMPVALVKSIADALATGTGSGAPTMTASPDGRCDV